MNKNEIYIIFSIDRGYLYIIFLLPEFLTIFQAVLLFIASFRTALKLNTCHKASTGDLLL